MNTLYKKQYFSLMELVVCLAIMSVVAGGALVSFEGLGEDAQYTATVSEMQIVKKALLQFYHDMGTLPGQGKLSYSNLQNTGQTQAEFESAANMIQLFVKPEAAGDEDQFNWSIDRSRGWRGPYISINGNGLVTIGTSSNFTGGTLLSNVYALSDAFSAKPYGSYFSWSDFGGTALGGTHGRPYIFEDTGSDEARIVSMGPDGVFGNSDDIKLYIFK